PRRVRFGNLSPESRRHPAAMESATQPVQATLLERAQWLRWLGPALSLALFAAVLYLLHRELAQHSWHDVLRHLRSLSPGSLVAAAVFTFASYTALTMVEALALRHVGQPVPLRISAVTSFVSYAVGHNIGLAALSGGAIRLRLYGSRGLPATDIAIVSAFCGVTTLLGLLALSAYALLAEPREASLVLHLG